MTKFAIVDAATVHQVWPVVGNATELAVRATLPNGDQISPIILGWDDGTYSVVSVTEFVIPEGQRIVSGPTYEISDGEVIETFATEAVPPSDRVTARQFKLQLLADGLLSSVEAWVASQSQVMQIAYEASGTFVRTEPMMQAGFAALNFTEQQIDDFFIAASEL